MLETNLYRVPGYSGGDEDILVQHHDDGVLHSPQFWAAVDESDLILGLDPGGARHGLQRRLFHLGGHLLAANAGQRQGQQGKRGGAQE